MLWFGIHKSLAILSLWNSLNAFPIQPWLARYTKIPKLLGMSYANPSTTLYCIRPESCYDNDGIDNIENSRITTDKTCADTYRTVHNPPAVILIVVRNTLERNARLAALNSLRISNRGGRVLAQY